MDLETFEERFKIGSIIIFIVLIILITKSNFSVFENGLPSMIYAVILLPLAILAIYYVSQINKSVLSHYDQFCRNKEKEIQLLREK